LIRRRAARSRGIEVHFANRQKSVGVDAAWYRRLAKLALAAEDVGQAEVSVAFVDNATIHQLNREYLRHDFPTDVITFPLSAPGEPLVGQIVVSGDYALEACAADGWPPHVELGLYLVHGVLHLCGYDDTNPTAARRMDRRQRQLLAEYLAKPSAKRYANRK
jgi:probable rRNA maturation factor